VEAPVPPGLEGIFERRPFEFGKVGWRIGGV
jgi:hypothetical protein